MAKIPIKYAKGFDQKAYSYYVQKATCSLLTLQVIFSVTAYMLPSDTATEHLPNNEYKMPLNIVLVHNFKLKCTIYSPY